MPVAFSAVEREAGAGAASSCARSRPRDGFFGGAAALALDDLGADLRDFSSSARRASFSAFLRASSAFLAASASLWILVSGSYAEPEWDGDKSSGG